MTHTPVWMACAMIVAAPVLAQAESTSAQSLKGPGCQAATAEPATRPAPASRDGTAPGNSGSTGWSGGLGGSTIGTSQNGAVPGSKSYQPATARGLDPIAAPPKTVAARC